jgi:arylsulfatase A-like enzyme
MRIKATVLLVLLLGIHFTACTQKEVTRPNILFIEVDDLEYEYLSMNGAPELKTPNIDKLAKSGVYFRNAVAQGMMCGPSRNSLITGLYPHNLGFYRNGQLKKLPDGVWTFPQGLQRSGYYTAWIGKCHIRAGGKNNLKTQAMKNEMGFDQVTLTEGRAVLCSKVKKGKYSENDWYLSYLISKGKFETFKKECGKPTTLDDQTYLDGFFTHAALNFLNDYKTDKPFFLWLNYSVPHGPWDVAEKYHIYDPEKMPGSTKGNFTPPENLVKATKVITDNETIKKRQAGFCANINFLDQQIGKILKTLKDKDLYDNTIIVFFSDQGVMMGDHQRIHKGTLYRQITNPALIISWPAKMKQDLVVKDPVELTDLIRTTFEIAGVSKKDINKRKYSVSLLPALMKGKKVDRKYAFGEIEGFIMVTDGRYRLIKGEDTALLFDDLKDPKNLNDISAGHPEIVKELSEAIDNWIAETGKPLPPRSF